MAETVKFEKSSGNVFEDVGFSKEEARNLQFRSYLMITLIQYVENKGLSQKEAAKLFNVTQPRISNLKRGKIDLFSTGALIDMLERAGFKIYEKIEEDIEQEFESHNWSKPSKKIANQRVRQLC